MVEMVAMMTKRNNIGEFARIFFCSLALLTCASLVVASGLKAPSSPRIDISTKADPPARVRADVSSHSVTNASHSSSTSSSITNNTSLTSNSVNIARPEVHGQGSFATMDGGNTGRGKNHLAPDPQAQGPHSTFRRDASGNISHHAEWSPNAKNPTGFDQTKRVDTQYSSPHTHRNKYTKEAVPTPHVHDKSVRGGVRRAGPDELPRYGHE
jgi:hypothetical protein